MREALASIDRRTLLIGGGIGIGLVVAFAAWPRHLASDLATRNGEQAFGAFLKIGHDGRVTVAVPQVETGQGIWTAMPQIVADELGAAWETVAVEPAPLGSEYANSLAGEEGWLDGIGRLRRWKISDAMRITAGSTSVRAFERPLRLAGATARAMLIAAAAERWDVPVDECDTADGFVLTKARTFTFAELAEEAAGQSPPSDPPLRTSPKNRLIGQPLPRLDLPAKSDGSFRFAADVRLPDMLFASARIAPPGGRLTGFGRQNSANFIIRNQWLAVAADSWWAAERALHASNPHFSAPESPSRDGILAMHQQLLESGDGSNWFSRGDYDSAVEGSRPLSATYWVAPAQHLGLEPLTATARFSGDHLEVWGPSQAPDFARAAAIKAAGQDASEVTLYPMPVGDSAGRAMEADAVAMAVDLARDLKRPVQLSLSPSSSQNHDRVAPAALARMTALPGAGGITAAWKMRVAISDGLGSAFRRFASEAATTALGRTALDGAIPPYAIPDVSIDAVPVKSPFPTGYLRGHPQRAMTFFTESFIDELAHAAGLEPLAFRMTLLGGNPRLARCIQAAASAGDWDGGARGSTLGLAACSAFGSHIGLMANATIGADQAVEVHRLVAAVDCGRIVNPQLVRQQIEGGLIWALGLANVREPDWAAGMPRSRPLGAIGLPRIARTPEIHVQLIPSRAAPGGVSGLGVALLAPAVANAIFAATGKRLRNLPFDPTSVG
ncbi:molybdopterin cofactor-binding domain-containing protein [Sphingomonas sp.]|uniref:molybdopterin cofactor-binding domain-containing protein n=1 Tax=Sphingomonas sp. TaxID=28214 RepID=UPI00286BCE06|nr:molybdopterin cofactor-binding domain-containing protein [Sphingomonas sp.]